MTTFVEWFRSILRSLSHALRGADTGELTQPRRVRVGSTATFSQTGLQTVEVDGSSIIIAHVNGEWCAVRNQCAHLPVPLSGGKVESGTIICPFHNSRFDLCSGANLDWTPGVAGVTVPAWTQRLIAMGREPEGIPSYPVTLIGNDVFIDI
jgi:nitrite reductase/ring-hydroxylating ferredoxin subunit